MARKARRRLPRAIKKTLEKQQYEKHAVEGLAPLQQQPSVLSKPPSVKQVPLQLPAFTSSDSEALVLAQASQRPDDLLRAMGKQVLVGQQMAGACDFWIELKEEILGGLQIRLSLGQGQVSASLIAKTKEAETLLLERLPLLKKQLRERGMRVGQLEVIFQPLP